jgi:hypothetical protein
LVTSSSRQLICLVCLHSSPARTTVDLAKTEGKTVAEALGTLNDYGRLKKYLWKLRKREFPDGMGFEGLCISNSLLSIFSQLYRSRDTQTDGERE